MLLSEVRACQICQEFLPSPPRPILSVGVDAKILIIGQAPGRRVHEQGIPWEDKSGETLHDWLGVTKSTFQDTRLFGTMPMGFCFPGSNPKGGDLPPRPECAPAWHQPLLDLMPNIQLKLIIGQHAMKVYLPKPRKKNLTESVRSYQEFLPQFFPLVHPSPLNFRWHTKNKWFVEDVVPELRRRVAEIIG